MGYHTPTWQGGSTPRRQATSAPGQPRHRPATQGQQPATGQPRHRPAARRRPAAPPTSRTCGHIGSRPPARGGHIGRRPPARGGPTIYGCSSGRANTSYIVGPPLAGGLGRACGRRRVCGLRRVWPVARVACGACGLRRVWPVARVAGGACGQWRAAGGPAGGLTCRLACGGGPVGPIALHDYSTLWQKGQCMPSYFLTVPCSSHNCELPHMSLRDALATRYSVMACHYA